MKDETTLPHPGAAAAAIAEGAYMAHREPICAPARPARHGLLKARLGEAACRTCGPATPPRTNIINKCETVVARSSRGTWMPLKTIETGSVI